MDTRRRVCFVLLAVVSLGKTYDVMVTPDIDLPLFRAQRDTSVEEFPNLFRAADLLSSIMLLLMYTNAENYDLYFFSPALRSFNPEKINRDGHIDHYNTLIKFLVTDFSIQKHASDFEFSDTETADNFLARFLSNLEMVGNLPHDVKKAVSLLKSDVYHGQIDFHVKSKGFIKPCPIYILLRIMTLIAELDYRLVQIQHDDHLDSVDVIIEFLTKDFERTYHGEGLNLNEGQLKDIANIAYFGFSAAEGGNKHLILGDKTEASKKNKEFFLHILPKVPENVRKAINTTLPYL